MTRLYITFVTLVIAAWALFLGGCSLQSDVKVQSLDVHLLDWDNVQLEVDFVRAPVVGKSRSVTPEAFSVIVFDASYDTLYAGEETLVPIPDERLGDREQLIVEVCGTFDPLTVCEQAGLSASPKRILVDPDIEYPKGGDVGEGSYALRVQVERQQFGGDEWEVIDQPAPLETYLVAYVEDIEQGAVQIPLRSGEGRFELAQHENHREFDFHLRSTLMNRDEVLVRFDVLASLNRQPARRIATVERPVRRLTHDERELEVGYFAEQVAEQILYDILGVSEDQTASVYIDEWNYMAGIGRYRIDMEMRWRSGFLGFSDHRIYGQLELQGDGSRVRFRQTDANRRAARLWDEHVDEAVLQLAPVERLEQPLPSPLSDEEPIYDPTRHASNSAAAF